MHTALKTAYSAYKSSFEIMVDPEESKLFKSISVGCGGALISFMVDPCAGSVA